MDKVEKIYPDLGTANDQLGIAFAGRSWCFWAGWERRKKSSSAELHLVFLGFVWDSFGIFKDVAGKMSGKFGTFHPLLQQSKPSFSLCFDGRFLVGERGDPLQWFIKSYGVHVSPTSNV